MQADFNKTKVIEALDLHALVIALWRQRIVILCLAVLGGIVGASYAFLSEPVFEAKAFISAPTQNDVESLNYGRTSKNHLPHLTVKDVYTVFLKNLQGESLRREFFDNTYLPALGLTEDLKGLHYEKLSKDLTISIVGKEAGDRYAVTVQNGNSEMAAAWVAQYLNRANELAVQEINKNISSEFEVYAQNLHQEIVSLREVGDKTRKDKLAKLQEALIVAQAIGLEKPMIVGGDTTSSLSMTGTMDGDLMYMRGAKALEAEIENLKSRKSDDPFINKLRDVEAEYGFYIKLSENVRQVKTFRMDGAVEESGSPVKPKKALVILAGLVLGLMLGILTAFIRNSFFISERK